MIIFKSFEEYLLEQKIEQENTKDSGIRIFCDLDGVLTDYRRGFKRLKANNRHLTPNEYKNKYGKESIWPLIDYRGLTFWKRLPWTKDGRALWDYIKRYSPIILSAPNRGKDSDKGRLEWIRLNLDFSEKKAAKNADEWDGSSRVIFSSDKGSFVKGKSDILIDDIRSNIDAWVAAGGTGVHHNDATDTIRVIENIIREIQGFEDVEYSEIDTTIEEPTAEPSDTVNDTVN